MKDAQLWEENYHNTWKLVWFLFVSSVSAFILSGLYSAVFISDTEFFTLMINQKSLIGSCLFGVATVLCWLAENKVENESTSQMLFEEKEKYVSDVRKLRGLTIFFFILFGMSFVTDDLSWATNVDKEKALDYFIASMLSGAGIVMMILALVARKMADSIKTKYLGAEVSG